MLMESSHSYLQYLSPLHPSKESHFVSHEFPIFHFKVTYLLDLLFTSIMYFYPVHVVAKVGPKVCIYTCTQTQ